MKKAHLSQKLSAYSVAAGLAAVGAASTANAALNVYDHRAAPLYPIVEYWDGGYYLAADQTLAVLNVKTGAFQYVVDNLDAVEGPYQKYDENGLIVGDTAPIDDALLTNDTVWFKHRDLDVDIGFGGPKPGDAVVVETPTGGAAGRLDAAQGPVYTPERNDPASVANDWYWADQAGGWLPYPVDGAATDQVDGTLSFNDTSPTGYTGAVSHGFGGIGYGSGMPFGLQGQGSLGFKLEEADGTHYGWVAVYAPPWDRNRISIHGWAYQTTPGAPAPLIIPGQVTVVLDIKPGSDPNSVNLKSKGLLPVVVYGSEGLDLTEIDLETLLLNGVGPRLMPDGSWHVSFEDVDGDLLLDLVMHFEMQALGIEPGMTDLALTGLLMDGTELQGADAIRIVPDFNGDLMLNATDLAIMKHSYGSAGVGFELGDANADGLVDATDLALLRLDFDWTESAFGQPIPEPAMLPLLAIGGLAVIRRRRRAC